MTAASRLQAFLAPRSIALVGIPGDVRSPLARPLLALRRHGFPGAVYPVNPRHASIGGVPCYASLGELPEPPDLAWIAVPGDRVLPVLDECVAAGVRGAVVVSAGFAESDADGQARQRGIAERAERHGLTVLGPNSIGFVNVWEGIPLSFSTALGVPRLVPGEVAIVSQSGGIGGAIFNRLQDRQLGVSYLLSTGNEADVGLNECLEFLVEDPRTRALALVVEGIRDGQEFRRVAARALEMDKAIVALRLGLTPLGGRLARSHTGAIVGSRRAWEAVASQLGIMVVDGVAAIPDVLVWMGRAGGACVRRVAVIASSGGAAVHLADHLTMAGFEVPPMGAATGERLRAVLPPYASLSNPLDITAGLPEETFEAALTAVAGSRDFDALLVPLTMLSDEQTEVRVTTIAGLGRQMRAPVGLCWLGGSLAAAGIALADRLGVASFPSPAGMIGAMAAARARQEARQRWLGRKPIEAEAPLAAFGRGVLSYAAACELLGRFGIPVPRQALAPDATAAVEAARRVGYPVALKVVGPDFLHKSDRGALRLGLGDEVEVLRAAGELLALAAGARHDGLLVQPMVAGLEVMLGAMWDDTFGPLLLLGPGGVAVELSQEHRCLALPTSEAEISAALDSVPSFRRLRGYRHEPARDRPALLEVIGQVSQLALALGPALRELDLNPVIVGAEGEGVSAVDVLVVLGASGITSDRERPVRWPRG